MDFNSEDSYINLDDDRDVSSSDNISSDESQSEHDNHSNGENNNEEVNITEDQFKKLIELTGDEIKSLEFGSEDDAYKFYLAYGHCNGFGVRKDDVRRDSRKNVVKRQFLCNKAGLRDKKHFMRSDRKREHRPLSRTNCGAKLRVFLNYKTGKWSVSAFEETHNHELTARKFVPIMPSCRGLSDADKAQVDALHAQGVRTCQIMGFLMHQKGGYANIGFCKKDLYNYIDQLKRAKIKDGDAMAALSYLQGKADNDPMFFSKYLRTDDGKLKHIFWADGTSRVDYQCFGDVVAFDSTYRKNKYNKPLVIFSGKNHHSETVIFACALVADETTDAYKWVLEMFLEAMCNKHPTGVVTDGDGAMREAIKQVFPNASHRLCAWHLNKNACQNVKNAEFLDDFKQAMYCNFTPDEFEEFWKEIVVKHHLEGNEWVSNIYEKKSMWATAYLRDKFFAQIRTTSQCESINSVIKAYVRSKNLLIEFLHNFEHSLRGYRYNELISDYNSLYTEPVLTTPLLKIELEASKLFTLNIFKKVRSQIGKAGSLNVIERKQDGNSVMFKLNEYGKPRREGHVVYDTKESKFLCDCRLFESCGIPCCHIFCAMRLEHIESILTSLICNRWKKDVKSGLISSDEYDEMDPDMMTMARFGVLVAACNKLCDVASKKREYYNEVKDVILKLTERLERQGDPQSLKCCASKEVDDPTIVKTKGAPTKKKNSGKRQRRCSHCNKTGHIIRTCPRLRGLGDELSTDDDSSGSESDGIKKEQESTNEDVPSMVNNENEGKVRRSGNRKKNRKKMKTSSQKSNKESELKSIGSASTTNRENSENVHEGAFELPQHHMQHQQVLVQHQQVPIPPQMTEVSIPPQGSQGTLQPLYSQFSIPPQWPDYQSGLHNLNPSGTRWRDLVEEVSKKGGGTNGNSVQPCCSFGDH